MDRPTKIWPGMNPRPADGETRQEFEARWSEAIEEICTFTQESKVMADEMARLPFWKLFTQIKMLREVERRNALARELLAVTQEMGEAYRTHKWPRTPLNLH